MVRAGDTMDNPVTGERITWVRTSAQTGGALAEMDLELTPDAFLNSEHIHLHQEERFEVLDGRIRLRSGGEESVLGPGEIGVVPAGSPHTWAPQDGKGARVRVTFTPGAQIEEMFDEFFRCAREGRTNAKGFIRSPFVGARLALAHDLYLAQLPVPLQRAVFRMVTGAARLLPIDRR
jgi:mannose-6-phosphate isomerase-like protein (cupin superfamily)